MYEIYALRKNFIVTDGFYRKEIIYVGMTSNLKNRLKKHKSKGFDDYIILDVAENKEEAKIKEDFYIMRLDPELNKCTNKFGHYDTLSNCIKDFNINDYGKFIHLLINREIKPLFSNKYSVIKINDLYHSYLMEEMRREIG